MNEFIPKNWKNLLNQNGHFMAEMVLSDTIKGFIAQKDWNQLDEFFQKETSTSGKLFHFLRQFEFFESIEFIISIRDADNEWEEDGIWHDDGSRKLAFSLGLNETTESIEGGILEIQNKKTYENFKLPPFTFGKIVIFLTGTSGFEHKINAVTKGQRIIIAGWCS